MKLRDLETKSKVRIGVDATAECHLTLYLDTPNGFWKCILTHQEARQLAFMLMGSSDPYRDLERA